MGLGRVRARVQCGVAAPPAAGPVGRRLGEGVREGEALEVLNGKAVELVAPEVRARCCNPKYQRLQP